MPQADWLIKKISEISKTISEISNRTITTVRHSNLAKAN